MSRLRFLCAAAVAASSVAVLAGSAGAAEAGGPTLHDGRVVADGAAVEFALTLKCPEGWLANVGLGVVQAQGGNRFAVGQSENSGVRCTGERQRIPVHVQVFANNQNYAFRAGKLSVKGTAQTYDATPRVQPALPVPVGPLGGLFHQADRREFRTFNLSGVVRVR